MSLCEVKQEEEEQSHYLLTSDEVESLLAKAMTSMSIDERNKVLEEIHGVPTPDIEETVGFVASKLDEFDMELTREKSNIYETALNQSREYVEDTSFRLMFLRSVQFDVPAATKRLISFLELKVELYGPEKLTKDITLSDLTEDTIELLKSGIIQVLPERDSTGRSVVCVFPELKHFMSDTILVRIFFFLFFLFFFLVCYMVITYFAF